MIEYFRSLQILMLLYTKWLLVIQTQWRIRVFNNFMLVLSVSLKTHSQFEQKVRSNISSRVICANSMICWIKAELFFHACNQLARQAHRWLKKLFWCPSKAIFLAAIMHFLYIQNLGPASSFLLTNFFSDFWWLFVMKFSIWLYSFKSLFLKCQVWYQLIFITGSFVYSFCDLSIFALFLLVFRLFSLEYSAIRECSSLRSIEEAMSDLLSCSLSSSMVKYSFEPYLFLLPVFLGYRDNPGLAGSSYQGPYAYWMVRLASLLFYLVKKVFLKKLLEEIIYLLQTMITKGIFR